PEDVALEPGAKLSALSDVAALDQQHASLELQDGDSGHPELRWPLACGPRPHARVRPVGPTQLRQDVGIQQIHRSGQPRSTGRVSGPSRRGGSKSKSPPSDATT